MQDRSEIIPCKLIKCGNPLDGYDWDCEYPKSAEMQCDDCICTGGYLDPRTGNRFYRRKAK